MFTSTSDQHNPKFTAGSTVYAKLYQNADKWIWVPGTVLEVFGGVNFNVLLDHQAGRRKLIRSHVNQLRPRCDDDIKPSSVSTPLNILVEDFDLRKHVSVQQTASPRNTTLSEPGPVNAGHHQDDSAGSDEFFETGSTISNQPSTQSPAVKSPRPARASRLPKRLEDYIVG